MFCKSCGKEIGEESVVCVGCGAKVVRDEPSVGLNIVGFLFPLVGIILWLLNKGVSPIKSKGIIKWTLISIGLNIVLSVFWFIMVIASFGGY